jgi:olefin beta-lactone synthetase
VDDRGELYPFAVEAALSFYPEVRRSALIGHRGRRLLFVEWADVRRDRTPRPDGLDWAQLDEIRSCRKIPVDKRHNAKVDYEALRRLLPKS